MGEKIAILGSGPVGAAAAYALLKETDSEIEMLDVGKTIEADLSDLTGRSSLINPLDARKRIASKRKKVRSERSDVPDKLHFGSHYVYDDISDTAVDLDASTFFKSSLAKGGLGNVWGANVCAVHQADIQAWPFESSELSPYFQLLQEFVPISSELNIIDSAFDYKLNGGYNYPLGMQGSYVNNKIATHGEELRDAGIFAGRAKIAVGKTHAAHDEGCVSCGLCMHGCPYDAIYNPKFTVEKHLVQSNRFSYRDNCLVESFNETQDGKVTLHIKDLLHNVQRTEQFDRVFVACGSIGSTVLVARSCDWTDHEFTFLDSQKYLFPYLLKKRQKGALLESSNTLAQIYLQCRGEEFDQRTLHFQLYGYNELMLGMIEKNLGCSTTRAFEKLATPFLERVMIGMVYMHSDVSGTLKMKISPRGKGWGSVRGSANPVSKRLYRKTMKRLFSNHKLLGGVPLTFATLTNKPGNSQHFGGSLPMHKKPEKYQTDSLGRPYGTLRTHVIDTSVFTSIPGTPTTLPAMANAVRIVLEASKSS